MPGNIYYDDVQGNLVTAVSGAATWSNFYLRGTNQLPAYPHIYGGDIFAMTFQMPHRKTLGLSAKSVHLHWIAGGTSASSGANAPADGTYNIRLNFTWGWYDRFSVVPTTLPNSTGSPVDISVTVTGGLGDMWKMQITNLPTELAAPAGEGYSSILMVRCLRTNGGADTYPAGLVLVYMDAHVPVDRQGSVYEYSDVPPGTL